MSSPYPFALPPNPNLEQLRNQAKDLLRAFKEGDIDVPSRLRRSIPEMTDLSDAEVFRSRFALKGARRVIAREYGFTEWTDLKREVETAPMQDGLDANIVHQHNPRLPRKPCPRRSDRGPAERRRAAVGTRSADPRRHVRGRAVRLLEGEPAEGHNRLR